VVLLAGLASCSAGPAPAKVASTSPGGTPGGSPGGGSPRSSPAVQSGGPAAGNLGTIIESVRIRHADTGSDTEVDLVSDHVAAEQPTLDLCYARFGSETHRVARRLYAVTVTEGTPVARNDVVVYDSAAAAQQALAEARQAVAGCPPGVPRQSLSGDQPPAAFRYAPLPATALSGLAPGAFAVTEITAPAGGPVRRQTRIVQQRGRVLVVLDGDTGQPAALALARTCARRLAALPAATAGA